MRKRAVVHAEACVFCLLAMTGTYAFLGGAWAEEVLWIGPPGGSWSHGSHWDSGSIPSLETCVRIPDSAGGVDIRIDSPLMESFCGGLILEGGASLEVAVSSALYIVGPGDLDGDGLSDRSESFTDAMDIDGDGKPNFDDTDSDDDAFPDAWEHQYGSEVGGPFDPYYREPPGHPGHPDFDFDEDGFTNWEEFERGSDPTDPESIPLPALGFFGFVVAMALLCASVLFLLRRFPQRRRGIGAALLLLALGGLCAYYSFTESYAATWVNFSLGERIPERIAGGETSLALAGDSVRPWNGCSTYVCGHHATVMISASGGSVYLGGMRETIEVGVLGRGTVAVTSLYQGEDHFQRINGQVIAYGVELVTAYQGERLRLEAEAATDWQFYTWQGSFTSAVNPFELQLDRAGLVSMGAFYGPGVDLVVTFESPPQKQIKAIAPLEVNFRVTNLGSDATEGTWEDAILISRDPYWDAEDLLTPFASSPPSLGAGESYVESFYAPNFPDLAPGQYYILVVTDVEGSVQERLERNNVASAPLVVRDLILDHRLAGEGD